MDSSDSGSGSGSATRPLGAPLAFSEYDRRGYPMEKVADGYRQWAPHFADVDGRLDLDLFRASGWLGTHLSGARVMDQACGTGRIGRWLREQGIGSLVGVDLTAEMLERAQQCGAYDEAHHRDFCDTGLAAGSFDGIVNSMALCHAPDLAAWFAEAARLLGPQGWVTLVDFHPFFMMLGVPTHFLNPETGCNVAIENYVHPLSEYFRLGAAAGFALREMEERFVDDEWIAAHSGYAKHRGLPVTFLMTFQRTNR